MLQINRIFSSKCLSSILVNKSNSFTTSLVICQDQGGSGDKDLLFEGKNNNERADNISKAMVYYLEKLNEREQLIKVKTEEFEIGKRHLAKMMGENAEEFTQADIDKAIEYLLPSGLFIRKARPFLKHPDAYYPKSKLAAFNKDGRPLSHLFYTGQPELYQLTYEATQKLLNLKKLEDAMSLIKNKIGVNKSEKNTASKIDITGSVWINCASLSSRLNKHINEDDFNKFLILLKKLADHKLSLREEPFLRNFLRPFVPPIKMSDIPELETDESGRKYQEIHAHLRTAECNLKLYEGTGKILIKSEEGEFGIDYFETLTHRAHILFPFKVVDRVNKFDMEIEVNKGGMSCLAKAVRYAISKGLCSYVSADSIEKLRLAGLLTKDIRAKERKKFGQEGARRKYTWKKR